MRLLWESFCLNLHGILSFFLASWFLEAFKFRVLVSVLCPIMPYKLWLTSLNKAKTRWLFQYHIHIKRHGIKRRNRQSYTSYQDPLPWLVLWFYCDHDAIQVLMRHIKLCGKPYLRSGLSLFSFLFFSFSCWLLYYATRFMFHPFIPCRILLFSSKIVVLVDKGK